MSYTLVGNQIIDPLGCVTAVVHGLGTPGGRQDAAVMLAALNADGRMQETLRRLKHSAQDLASSGQPTEDGFRRLAWIVSELAEQAAHLR